MFLPEALRFALVLLLPALLVIPSKQEEKIIEPTLIDWQHSDALNSDVQGISSAIAYQAMEKRKASNVIVAVIDSGVDIAHEDLQGKIWVNEDEIPGNGLDDDQNGYIDDIHGWNFLGGAAGDNIAYETKEVTRIYRQYRDQFENQLESEIPPNLMEKFKLYQAAEKTYLTEKAQLEEDFNLILQFGLLYEVSDKVMREATGKDTFTLADVQAVQSERSEVLQAQAFLKSILTGGFNREEWHEYEQQIHKQVDYHYNLDYNPRDIVGDDLDDTKSVGYGNNDVYGSEPIHGTHVAGIIAAIRGNNIGSEGVAEAAKIMCLRAVPNGDERDKDIANAIKYAVDNGAKIINLSFGKDFSPREGLVEEAILAAEQKEVLIVHAAGNDGQNLQEKTYFPNGNLESRKASNWIEVGASGRFCNKNLAASFSNYGQEYVDVFAPGVDIFGLSPNNEYDMFDGTSMAAPVVSGVAALVWSYFPYLTAVQLKSILMESAIQHKRQRVYLPASDDVKRKKTKFRKLSKQGGIINAYTAVLLAEGKESN